MDQTVKKVLALVGVLALAVMVMGAAIQGVSSTNKTYSVLVDTAGRLLNASTPLKTTGNAKSYCVGITDTDADFTLDTGSDYFEICAYGNTAYLTFKDTAPAVDHVVNDFDYPVASGQCKTRKQEEALVAVIGTTTAGFICFEPLEVE